MKVGFVSHTSRMGGAERSLLETIRVLLARGVACTVLLPARGPLTDALERMGVGVHVIPYKWWSGTAGGRPWKRVARTAWNLIQVFPTAWWIRRQGVDVVYTNTIVTAVGALAAALTGRCHVWHFRELGHVHNRMVFDLGERLSLRLVRRLSTLCLANSNCVAARYRDAMHPKPVNVVDQGVRLDDESVGIALAPADGFRCAVIGSIGPSKRQEEAIRAIALLRGQGFRVELLIVGVGDQRYEQLLRELVLALDVSTCVSFLGQLDTAAPVIRGVDVLVNCSRHEAFGRVTVEGMLAGTAVVGARSAGTAELIRDGHTGLLYEPGDVEQLAGILRRLIEHPAEARRIGQAARVWATDRFNEERFGEEILAHLRPLVGTGAR